MLIQPEPNNSIITFIHEMIPHHQNAIQMSKALLESGQLNDPAFELPDDENENPNEIMQDIAWNIINSQSHQIQKMEAYLKQGSVNRGSAKCLAPEHG